MSVWYIDGVSCLGKTTFVRNAGLHGLKLDYAERCQQHPFFVRKSHDHAMQVLYTASFCATVQRHIPSATTTQPLVVDRSPISDVWYELLFKHYDEPDRYRELFDYIDQLDLFSAYPTLFVLPHPSHAERICDKMRERSNGLDVLTPEYVRRQIHVFQRVIERFQAHPRVRVLHIAADTDMFTDTYFQRIEQQIVSCLFDDA